MKDPMQMRRAGYLRTGQVLVAGEMPGILPILSWAGAIIVVAGLYVSFFV